MFLALTEEAHPNLVLAHPVLALYVGWAILLLGLKFLLGQIGPLLAESELPLPDPGLSYWDGIFILITAVVVGILAALFTTPFLVGVIIMIFGIAGGAVWLFGKPYPGWVQAWRDSPRWLLWACLFIALAPLILIALICFYAYAFGLTVAAVVAGLVYGFVFLVIAAVGIFLAIIIWGCEWVRWWEKTIKRFADWYEEQHTATIKIIEETKVLVEKWVEEQITEAITYRKSGCSGWPYGTQWACQLGSGVDEVFYRVVKQFVKVSFWVTKQVVRFAHVVVTVLVFVVRLVTVWIPKAILLCGYR